MSPDLFNIYSEMILRNLENYPGVKINGEKAVTLLDRLGHCVSHSTLLELEKAMCGSVKENDSNLKPGAAKQAVITNFTAKYKEEKQILVNYMPPINASVNEL